MGSLVIYHKRRTEQKRCRKSRVLEYIHNIKVARGCSDCGYNAHAEALDFDHLPGHIKRHGVSRLVNEDYSLARVAAEIAKCEVVCANCHRVRTSRRRVGTILELKNSS